MIKAYGDTLNDGKIQLSFTLPVAHSEKAREGAKQYVLKLGFTECEIVYSCALADEFSFFIVYAVANVVIDYESVKAVTAVDDEGMDFYEVNDFIRTRIGRKITVVGACTGTDAHTVGIDAIMNMKGYNHHYGLERYQYIDAHNLGAQVPNEKLIEYSIKVNADAILVSQVVTQKDVHLANMTELIELLEAENIRHKFILIAGGPRIDNKLAMELGFDAGFGRETYAEHVASFIARRIVGRMHV